MTKQKVTIKAATNVIVDEPDIIQQAFYEALGEDWTLEAAARWLNTKLPEPYKTTKQSVHDWIHGTFKMKKTFLFSLNIYYEHTELQYKLAQALMTLREEKASVE